jgi:FxsC-like protein
MGCHVFISYAKKNCDRELKRFVRDLRASVEATGNRTIFFAEESIKGGATWTEDIATALQQCHVLVALFSGHYFSSEHCKQELKLLEQRFVRSGVPRDRHFKPILWTTLVDPIPLAFRKTQLWGVDSSNDYYRDNGLRSLIVRNHGSYKKLLMQLSREVVHAPAFPALDPCPTYDSLSDTPELTASKEEKRGPRYVYFVYVAGKPDEWRSQRIHDEHRSVAPYLERGGEDWRPFVKQVRHLAGEVASKHEFDVGCIEFCDSLEKDVTEADDRRNLVILIVDSWTVALPQYRAILTRFDSANLRFCSVLMPWNNDDPQTARKRTALEQEVRLAFGMRRQENEKDDQRILLRDDIRSEDELRLQVQEALNRLKSRQIRRAPPCAAPPGAPLPTVSGQSDP